MCQKADPIRTFLKVMAVLSLGLRDALMMLTILTFLMIKYLKYRKYITFIKL
jgi:hypothetical protein